MGEETCLRKAKHIYAKISEAGKDRRNTSGNNSFKHILIMATIKQTLSLEPHLHYPSTPHPSFPMHRLTLFLLFSEDADLERVREIRRERRADADIIVVYGGKEQPWDRFRWMNEEPAVPWLDLTHIPTYTPSPPSHITLFLFRSSVLLCKYSVLPASLSSLPLPSLSPVPSLSSLASNNTGLIWAYSQVKQSCGEMDQTGTRELLDLLERVWEVELQGAVECYEKCRWGVDPDDVLNPRDITFKQFLRRLKNYCISRTNTQKTIDWEEEAKSLRIKLEQEEKNALVRNAQLEEQDRVIAELRQRLEEQSHSIVGEGLPASKSLHHSKEPSEDSYSLAQCSSFTTKLARRKGFAINTMLIGEFGNTNPHEMSVDIGVMGYLKPIVPCTKRKSPYRLGKTPRPTPHKPDPEQHSIKPANRVIFSSIRRTL